MEPLKSGLQGMTALNEHRLNMWERASVTSRAEGLTDDETKLVNQLNQIRETEFKKKKKLMSRYGTQCQILGADGDRVKGAHLYPHRSQGQELFQLNLPADFINGVRNGLLLSDTIEEAFDNLDCFFMMHKLTKEFHLWVVEPYTDLKTDKRVDVKSRRRKDHAEEEAGEAAAEGRARRRLRDDSCC